MAERKTPLLLRALIVVVALFLGLSLNMFQFRNPFRALWEPARAPVAVPARPEPSPPAVASGSGGATMPPGGQGGPGQDGGPSPEASGAPTQDRAMAGRAGQGGSSSEGPPPSAMTRADVASHAPEGADTAARSGSGVDQPVPGADKAPEALPDAQGDEQAKEAEGAGKAEEAAGQPAPQVAVVVEPAESDLFLPRVTTDRERARAAGIGRSRPVAQQATPSPPTSLGSSAPQGAAGKDVAAKGKPKPQEAKALQAATPQGPPQDPAAQARGKGPVESGAAGPAKAGQGAGKVLEIKAQERGGEFVLTLVTDGSVERVTSFHAKSPARLVVDLWGGWQPSGPLVRPVEGEMMEKIRLGVHPDKLRLAIDYKDKDAGGFSEPVVEKQPRGVVVRLPKTSAR